MSKRPLSKQQDVFPAKLKFIVGPSICKCLDETLKFEQVWIQVRDKTSVFLDAIDGNYRGREELWGLQPPTKNEKRAGVLVFLLTF